MNQGLTIEINLTKKELNSRVNSKLTV